VKSRYYRNEFKIVTFSSGAVFYLVKYEGARYSGISVITKDMKLVYTKDMPNYDIYDYDLIYNGEVLVFIAKENSIHYTYPK